MKCTANHSEIMILQWDKKSAHYNQKLTRQSARTALLTCLLTIDKFHSDWGSNAD